jgi:hypothetical protein
MVMVSRARHSLLAATLTFLVLAGCAAGTGEPPMSASEAPASPRQRPTTASEPPAQGGGSPGTTPPGPPAVGEPPARMRTVGPADQGHEVVVRFGELLDVVPATRPGGWQVADYPEEVLRLRGDGGPGAHHVFVAVALGAGEVRLVGGGAVFTVRVRVLRDVVQPPQP